MDCVEGRNLATVPLQEEIQGGENLDWGVGGYYSLVSENLDWGAGEHYFLVNKNLDWGVEEYYSLGGENLDEGAEEYYSPGVDGEEGGYKCSDDWSTVIGFQNELAPAC